MVTKDCINSVNVKPTFIFSENATFDVKEQALEGDNNG